MIIDYRLPIIDEESSKLEARRKTPVILSFQPPRKCGGHNAGMTYVFFVYCLPFRVTGTQQTAIDLIFDPFGVVKYWGQSRIAIYIRPLAGS